MEAVANWWDSHESSHKLIANHKNEKSKNGQDTKSWNMTQQSSEFI